MANILGISLGTRLVGLAVVYDGELTDFRVRTFYGPWNEKKRRGIVETIKKMIQRYGVTVLSVKAPKPAYCSKNITELLDDIQQVSEELNLSHTVCSISALKAKCNGTIKSNKEALIKAIAERYPQHKRLPELNAKEKANRSAYYVKLFEAIACTEVV